MIRVIIADDHTGMREAWRLVLNLHEEIEVVAVCSNGQEVIGACTELRPDLVLMDINMEPVGGFEATKLLLSKFPDLHIIGISINAELSYAQKMLQLGGKGFITKSSPSEEMIAGIKTAVSGEIYICEEIQAKIR